MIRISLLHPSRGRSFLAYSAVQEWLGKADNPHEIEYLMQLDKDDETIQSYIDANRILEIESRYKCSRFQLFIEEPLPSLAKVYNNLAGHASNITQLMITVNDDIGCPKHWDTLLWNELKNVNPYVDIKFIGVWDGVIEPGSFWDIFIATRAWYTKFGYVAWPEYKSSWIDFDWTGLIRTSDREFGTNIEINAQHLIFPHRHYSAGHGEQDDINKKLHTDKTLSDGEKILRRRENDNFGLS